MSPPGFGSVFSSTRSLGHSRKTTASRRRTSATRRMPLAAEPLESRAMLATTAPATVSMPLLPPTLVAPSATSADTIARPAVTAAAISTPPSPTGLVAVPGDARVNLTWSAPASNGGAAISDYVVQVSSNNGATWRPFADGVSTATAATVTGLTNGVRYTFRVAAVNVAGTGAASVASAAIVPVRPTPPPMPTGVTGVPGDGWVSLAWAAPTSSGGAAISDYVVQASSNNGATWSTFADGVSTATATTVTGLTNGTNYVFRVAAVNAAGTGAVSVASTAIMPRTMTTLPGYGVATSAVFYFSGGGWAGWSVPAGKVVLGAKIISPGDSIADFAVFKAAGPEAVFPHYSYGPAEYGWVMQATQPNEGVQIEVYYADPPTIDVQVSPAIVAEDSKQELIYTFTASAVTATPITVKYHQLTSDRPATEGVDFTGLPPGTGVRSITIPANATTAAVTVRPTPDSEIEPDETVDLALLQGTGYSFGSKTVATGTIENDDFVVDLDVDSDNSGSIARSLFEDSIEDDPTRPGVTVPVGGGQAQMIVDVPAGRTATLAFDADAASKVRVFSSVGAVVLDTTQLSTTVGSGPHTFSIEAFAPSTSMADIVFTLTLDVSTGSGSTGTTGSPSDTIRATAVALTAQSNGIISADDGRLWVYAVVSDPTRSSGDSPAVTFELLGADGSTTGVTGSATVVDSFAYTVLNLPDRLLHIDPANPAASNYRVRARYRSLTTESEETAVVPGLAKNIQAVANVAFTAKPELSFNITDAHVPFLRDFAGVGRVEVTATVRDRLGNLVADGTPVIWGTVDDGFNPDDVLNSGTETVNGVASFAIAADRISPVARLSVTADLTTITGFLSGGELRVTLELLDTNNQPAGDRIIDLDDRWWFSTRSETIRVRATVRRQDGSPVGPGVPVKFHDTKRLLDDVAVLTDSAGRAVADLFVPNDRASWAILGRNVVTASAAGYSAQAVTRIDGDILPPVEVEFSAAFLAGDQTNDGTVPLADPTALSDVTAVVNAPFAATSTITLRNLTPGEPYRLEVPANAPVQLRLPGGTPGAQVSFVAPPANGGTGSTFQIVVQSKGGMTGTGIDVVKPLLYLEATWWNWFEDPVGYSVKGDTAGTIIVGPASAAARIGQITQSIVGGALFGAGGLDASLAGDIGLSMIPGIGVAADVRDLGKSLLQLVPVDLGLGQFDWREAAIAGFGILTEVLPAADVIVDVYRSMYKIAKQVPTVMPVFLSIEPLFTKALTSLFDFRPAAASGSLTAAGDFAALAASASSASFGADDIFRWLEGVIGRTNARRLLAHTEIGKVLKNDPIFRGKYAELVRISGSKFGDDLETIFDAFGMDAVKRMVIHGTANLEDFGAGFNAMATALRRHSAGGTWQNTALLDSLKASPEDAADIFTDIGTTSRRVQEANIRFGKGIAGESDVSQAIALVIGRASGSTGHSFVRNIDELRNFSVDLKTLTDVGRNADQMRSAVALIRRLRSDGPTVPTQGGRLFEVQEVAAALRENADTVISFNKRTRGAVTDIDILLNGKAIELKYTLRSVTEQDIITKFFKYRATVGPGKPLELRSLDSEASMQAFVEGAFEKYIKMKPADWPVWLKRLSKEDDALVQVKNAISYSQAGSTRYNFFAAAG